MARLLFVIDNLEYGGGERVFLQLAAGLKDRFEVFAAGTAGGKFENKFRELSGNFYAVDMSSRFSLKPIRHLNRVIRKNKIDLVHSQGARADFFARMGGRMAGVSHIICTIAMPVEGFDVVLWRKRIYRLVDRLTERYVKKIVVVSDALKKTLIEKRAIPASKIVRIHNGIELGHYHPNADAGKIRDAWEIPRDVPLFGAIGRMVWQKGFEFLIKAMPEILSAIPAAKLLLVGEGPLKKGLENLAVSLKVKKSVIFAGYRSDITEILAAIDLLVVPSLLEGFPMITLEAMSAAKPVIATCIDGITEQIIDGKNGIMVPPEDHNALAKVILRLSQDRDLSKKLGMAARERVVREFTVDKMVAETEKVYSELLMGSHG
jgi:glycosyltransferase involved in cell wall biosynthesis